MWKLKYGLCFVVVCVLQICCADTDCLERTELYGNISEVYSGPKEYTYIKCWKIVNPENYLVRLEIDELDLKHQDCSWINLRINVNETGKEHKFCGRLKNKILITSYSDIKISFYVDNYRFNPQNGPGFELYFERDNGISGVKDVEIARTKAISWLKDRISTSWGWIENVPKAIIGLFLSGGATFNGTNIEEQLMVEQRELRVSVALLRNSLSTEQLSVFVNSLLVTCHNPRRFYGRDLIQRLKTESQFSEDNFTHPITYLALCNANESWPRTAIQDLGSVLLKNESEYSFLKDIQAFAILALSCGMHRSNFFNISQNAQLLHLYRNRVQQFKKSQLPGGNFGNVHTTSLITQALISSGHEYEKDWEASKAIKYLMKEMNSSSVSFLATYWTLPLLNGKTLADIAYTNCSGRSRDPDEIISEIHDHLGPKMRVHYSIFIGENKEVVYTMAARVPENFTAYDVMRFAEVKDSKYKFMWERVSGKMYVYDISKIPNDPEERKFWLLYLGTKKYGKEEEFEHYTSSPDEIVLEDDDHLVMWYRYL